MRVCYLRLATVSDADILLEWANDVETRANSFCSEKILPDEHICWLKKKLANDDCRLYIMTDGMQNYGQLRLDKEKMSTNISFSIAKQYRGRGYGKMMLQLAENEAQKLNYRILTASVKEHNTPSRKAFEALHYDIVSIEQGTIHYQKAVC